MSYRRNKNPEPVPATQTAKHWIEADKIRIKRGKKPIFKAMYRKIKSQIINN